MELQRVVGSSIFPQTPLDLSSAKALAALTLVVERAFFFLQAQQFSSVPEEMLGKADVADSLNKV
jgi:hypothetical protein